jgi:2,3-dihydroxybenzoate decarboxylase
VFDRFPRETLPFLLWRFDSRAGPDFYNVPLKNPPSHYIKQNIWVTTSGMCSAEPLNCTIAALGADRIMFAADYPFERAEEAGHWFDHEKLDEKLRIEIATNNAARLLKLT